MAFFKNIIQTIKGFFEYPGAKIHTRVGKTAWIEQGRWAIGESSYVKAIRYSTTEGALYVRYGKGAICKYKVSSELAQQMFHAPSLGRFARSRLFSLPYVKVG